ncbi:unnamed protein product [Bursaphelenchus okinawaensis]|uniref:Uncharacterized protein n=1 Tax=Bursaphelenchus okinawaensis TaxID=465554 RepID=A0A811JQI4_9BILA|nr:unnamed protein product [Bursaphelenchus okinawaensis]CAG9077874.1 unnamed protein product [Bursaphelenchus okinawaensis]
MGDAFCWLLRALWSTSKVFIKVVCVVLKVVRDLFVWNWIGVEISKYCKTHRWDEFKDLFGISIVHIVGTEPRTEWIWTSVFDNVAKYNQFVASLGPPRTMCFNGTAIKVYPGELGMLLMGIRMSERKNSDVLWNCPYELNVAKIRETLELEPSFYVKLLNDTEATPSIDCNI